MASGTPASPGRLAERLDHLFRTVLTQPKAGVPPREYRYVEVADAINAAAGTSLIAPNYLSYLRSGLRGHSGRIARDKLRAIEGFFGVPRGYLEDESLAAQVDSQLHVISLLREAGVRAIVLNLEGLTANMIETLLRITVEARTLAGLPPVEP